MTGKELKVLRSASKYSAQELANVLEISRTSLYRYEQLEDDVPGWLQYAAFYLLGHSVLVVVPVKRGRVRKVKPNSLPDPYEDINVGDADFDTPEIRTPVSPTYKSNRLSSLRTGSKGKTISPLGEQYDEG